MLGHRLLNMAAARGHRRFVNGLKDVESAQRCQLAELVQAVAVSENGRRLGVGADWSWEQFRDRLPVTGYEDWRATVERPAPATAAL